MKLSQLGEFGLIELLKKSQSKRKETTIGIGDDCAVIQIRNPKSKIRTRYLLVTTDALVENVHFRLKKTSFYDLGYYALFINASDVFSMGGEPTHAFVTIGVPGKMKVNSIQQFYKGLNALAKKLKIDISGGDTVSSDKFFISITLLGEVEKKYLVTRAGAKVGDLILVTGDYGGPAARKYELRTRNTELRAREARIIAKSRLATSMIDSSDGLVRSVLEVMKSSKVGALIYENEVPIAKGASLKQALHGGEEYELVFTVPRSKVRRLKKLLGKARVSIVGEMVAKNKGLNLLGKNGKIVKVRSGGYEHFRK